MKLNKTKNLVSYSKSLAEARYSLHPMEQKIVWAMTSLISPDDEDFKTYKVEVKHLAEYIGMDPKSALREIDKVTDSLMSKVLRIPIDEGRRLLKLHWVSHCILDKKYVEFSFHKNMKPYLLKLKEHFTSHKYRIIVSFRGSYTIRIYQLLKMYEYKGVYKCSLDELREILDVGECYKAFKEFKRSVINPAKKEFETKNKENGSYRSDITFDLKTLRTGRKITHLQFNILKQTYQESLPLDIPEQKNVLPAIMSLTDHGLSKPMAEKFVYEQGEACILRCVQLYEECLKAGKVKKTNGGYLISMLQSEAGKLTKAEMIVIEDVKKSIQKEVEANEHKRRTVMKEKLEKKFRTLEVARFLKSLSSEEQCDLLAQARIEYPLLNISSLDSPMCLAFLLPLIPGFEENKKNYLKKSMP